MKVMDFTTYQLQATKTAVYPKFGAPIYPALGLAGEAGEVVENVKKAVRDDGFTVTANRSDALHKELGDVLWYVAMLCEDLGFDMADVAAANLAKLSSRQERGVLSGSGDDR